MKNVKFYILILFILPFLLNAQTVEMSLTVQPSFYISIGETSVYPFRTESFQFGVSGGSFALTTLTAPFVNLITVAFPPNILTVPVDFFVLFYSADSLIPYRPLPTGKNSVIDNFYDLRAFEGLAGKTTFNGNFSITFYYTDAQISAFDEEATRVYFWNSSQNVWEEMSDFTLDQINNSIIITTNHLTLFGVFGQISAVEQETTVVQASTGGGGTIFPNKKGDFNGDKKVDVFDFNLLMVNWGKTIPSNLASVIDINNDHKIGAEDFSLLMVYWTG